MNFRSSDCHVLALLELVENALHITCDVSDENFVRW